MRMPSMWILSSICFRIDWSEPTSTWTLSPEISYAVLINQEESGRFLEYNTWLPITNGVGQFVCVSPMHYRTRTGELSGTGVSPGVFYRNLQDGMQ